jgi:NAD(P)H dehydrogenase (quinone)
LSDSQPRLIVTGAGGQLGRAIVSYLASTHTPNVIAASRHPEQLRTPCDYEARRIDFDDPGSMGSAFRGIDRALIISTDRVDPGGGRIRQHCAAIEAAAAAGVQHLLYTSMLNPERSLIPFAADHLETEAAIERSGIDFTILRVSSYTENLSPQVAAAFDTGTWQTCAGDGRINYVARNDVARTAAAALVSSAAGRQRIDVTGPQPLSTAEIVTIAERLAAAPLEILQLSDEQRADAARAAGISEDLAPMLVATEANMRAGNFDVASRAVEDLTGTAATSVEAFLAAYKVMWQP